MLAEVVHGRAPCGTQQQRLECRCLMYKRLMLLGSVVARARGLNVPLLTPRAASARQHLATGICTAAHARQHQPLVRMMCSVTPAAARIPGVTYNDEGVAVDEAGEPMSKTALKKAAKMAAAAAKKAAKKAEKAAAAAAAEMAQGGSATESGATSDDDGKEPPAPYSFSEPGVLMSDASPDLQQRVYSAIRDLGTSTGVPAGEEIWVRGRLSTLRAGASNAFLVLRQQGQYTVQACFFKSKETPRQSKEMLASLATLTEESIVDVRGRMVEATVTGCSQSNVELQLCELVVISRAAPALPFEIADAGRSEEEIAASEGTERPLPRIGQELRLNSRWIDLRVPANQAIMRTQSGICTLFREALLRRGFVEIHTPKLIAGESEGGSDVFTTDYFGRTACLAQSPQLYKQMAIASDLERVFEIGPVFRAEKSNTRRHLCEFTGLDLEMAFNQHYNEVIDVLHDVFTSIFDGLETRYADELSAIRAQYPSEAPRWTKEPCIVHWEDAMAMLEEAGEEAPGFDDLNTVQERTLGRLVAEKLGTDFFFLDRFPSAVRPFYTMPCPDDNRYSNSYDVFLRGEEICSGAQRVHDPELLTKVVQSKGVPLEPLEAYIDSMRHGMPPHGGGGVGLERVVFLYLGLDNVRKASMFPRDPSRCSP